MKQSLFAGVQNMGRALMLPIAVLPVAGLLLRLGQPDLLDIHLMAQAGDAIFTNLALVFSIGVAVGFAKENNGTAGLAGVIGYLVLTAVMKSIDSTINMGVLAGIVSGLTAGLLYNRYKDLALPSFLAFFGGKRFVPIATGFAMLFAGIALGYVWPTIQAGIDDVGHALIHGGNAGLFVYGVLNRLLIITGLHHILNSFVWFVFGSFPDPAVAGKVATGDLNRFFAGDPGAGSFMTGFFPVMMFGLPGACLAMYRTARPERRAAVGGILLSMALTSLFTGVTEPIEFSFMFLAPALYAIHAVLTGVSMALMHVLDVRLGFTFSAGLFDFLLSFGKGSHGLLMLPVGVAYFVLYYALFSYVIRRFNLPTLGRETAVAGEAVPAVGDVPASERALAYIQALGGAGNLLAVDACTTRLRLRLEDNGRIDETALKALGARGVIRPAPGTAQVVIGPEADRVAEDIRRRLASSATATGTAQPAAVPTAGVDGRPWVAALGGNENIRSVEAVAGSRLRVGVTTTDRIDSAALATLGALGVQVFCSELLHIVLPYEADATESGIRHELQPGRAN